MTLLNPSDPAFMTATEAVARRQGYAARSELRLRNLLESFCRARWPGARIVHEMVMGEGRVRADVVALDTANIVAFEVKGESDDTTRLLHQVGMYQLCVPEVWMVVPSGKHADDARLIRHLLPSVGLLVGNLESSYRPDNIGFDLTVEAEAKPRPVVPQCSLEMLWRHELDHVAVRLGIILTKKSTRPSIIGLLLQLPWPEVWPLCCAALRGRDALWRADPPIHEGAP